MVSILIALVGALLLIAASTVIAPRLRVASPLLLVAAGLLFSLAPGTPSVQIDPDWIIEGLLPPLLYASAVSMPAMSFRREFRAISGLSVLLVVVSSLVLGAFFMLVLPDLGFAWGVALGAIISPTDAVATSMIRSTSVSRRVAVILDGESLLNDASALVLMRTAIVATTAGFSLLQSAGAFLWSVAIAGVIGGAVGLLNLAVRRRVESATVNTLIGFAVPFVASVPTELLGGSGLFAAVVAGLTTGYRAARTLPPRHRLSDNQNWATIELALEGAVFLTLGLQLSGILEQLPASERVIPLTPIGVAVIALTIALLVRALYVAVLIGSQRRRLRHRMRPRSSTASGSPDLAGTGNATPGHPLRRWAIGVRALSARLRRGEPDQLLREPLGPREGSILVWAGMRGAVTVAAAQSLPATTPDRPMLVFIAFAVAILSLIIQGGTVRPLVRRLFPYPDDDPEGESRAQIELALLYERLDVAARSIPEIEGQTSTQRRIAALKARRIAILKVRDEGGFDIDVLRLALRSVDAEQIALELGPDR